MNKSKFACLSTLRKMSNAYLWTFTFAERLPVHEAVNRWHKLQKDLTRKLGYKGVRVFEFHPGGHGVHVHVVVEEYFDVNAVRTISDAAGFGRIHVEWTRNPAYVSKYVTKSGRRDWPKGTRLWASFGNIAHTRVRDVSIDSLGNDIFRAVRDCVVVSCGAPLRKLALLCYGVASGRYICRASDKGGRWTVSFYDVALDGLGDLLFSSEIHPFGDKSKTIRVREYDFV